MSARLANHDRHTGELTHRLQSAITSRLALRGRRNQTLRLRLETVDIRRTLSETRNRITSARRELSHAINEAKRSRQNNFKTIAGRLEALSPLAVLGRGYAVCWNAERTSIVRDANSVKRGQSVRVTLHNGELNCEVKSKK